MRSSSGLGLFRSAVSLHATARRFPRRLSVTTPAGGLDDSLPRLHGVSDLPAPGGKAPVPGLAALARSIPTSNRADPIVEPIVERAGPRWGRRRALTRSYTIDSGSGAGHPGVFLMGPCTFTGVATRPQPNTTRPEALLSLEIRRRRGARPIDQHAAVARRTSRAKDRRAAPRRGGVRLTATTRGRTAWGTP